MKDSAKLRGLGANFTGFGRAALAEALGSDGEAVDMIAVCELRSAESGLKTLSFCLSTSLRFRRLDVVWFLRDSSPRLLWYCSMVLKSMCADDDGGDARGKASKVEAST